MFAKAGHPSYAGVTNETYVGADRGDPGVVTLKGDWRTDRQYVELKADVHATSLGTVLQERRTDNRPVPVRVADRLGGSNDVVVGRSQEELRDSDEEPGPKRRDVAGVGRTARRDDDDPEHPMLLHRGKDVAGSVSDGRSLHGPSLPEQADDAIRSLNGTFDGGGIRQLAFHDSKPLVHDGQLLRMPRVGGHGVSFIQCLSDEKPAGHSGATEDRNPYGSSSPPGFTTIIETLATANQITSSP